MRSPAAALLAIALLMPGTPAKAQQGELTLVRCGAGGRSACLRLDAVLSPAQAGAVAPAESASVWRLAHAGAEREARAAAVPREARPALRLLVLVDVSGSMRGGGLQAARSALRAFLADLPAGTVRVAVVPFASARVAERIAAARFVAAPEATAQVEALPEPAGNTALYSAIRAGLGRLDAEPPPADSAWNGLLVITDGRNDVGNRGDDAGLLAGESGRREAVEAVRASSAQTWVLGMGQGLDAAELRALAAPRGSPLVVAEDPVALRRALEEIRGWIFTGREYLLPVGGSAQARLAPGPAVVAARAGETRVQGTWVPPVFALPAFQGRSAAPAGSDAAPDPWVARRAAVLAVFSGVLLVLWTAVPPLLRTPLPPPRPVASAAEPVPLRATATGARRRIQLRTEAAAVPLAGTVATTGDGLRPGLTEAPPRRPTDVTAKVSRPVQRT